MVIDILIDGTVMLFMISSEEARSLFDTQVDSLKEFKDRSVGDENCEPVYRTFWNLDEKIKKTKN